MAGSVSDTSAMIAQMDPALDDTAYCFVEVTPEIAPQVLGAALATIREEEGVCAIVPARLAIELGIEAPRFARITLQVHSDLEGVGLTAAVSTALATEGIACNVVAALRHDHLFVPEASGGAAMAVLRQLQRSSG